MSKRFQAAALALLLTLFLALGSKAQPTMYALESSELRVELSTAPYSFKVFQRGAGGPLLSENRATFTSERYPATSADEVVATKTLLRATLHLSGSPVQSRVEMTFTQPDVLKVVLSYKSGGSREISERFESGAEHYYGLREYPLGGSLETRGEMDLLGVQKMPDVNYASARAPFFFSSRKYGVYVQSTAQGRYSVAVDGNTGFSFQDSTLTYYVIHGASYQDILSRYNGIAGPSVMPPDWAFDSFWWRDNIHKDYRGVKNAQEKLLDDADQLRRLHIHASTVWLDRPYGTGEDGWGNSDFDDSFPRPAQLFRDLNSRGMHALVWIANRSWNSLGDEGRAKGFLCAGNSDAVDMRNKDAYAWFKEKLRPFARLGVQGYKIDRGEEGEMPDALQNENTVLFAKMAAEEMARAYGNDHFIFARNAYDTTRRYSAVWNGDSASSFRGLEMSVKNALRCGLIDFPMWGSDTGGYLGVPNKELLARWLGFSAYSPMMEVLIDPQRTVWSDFDSETTEIARKHAAAHHDLIPYTRSSMQQAVRTGMPVMRALLLAYPDDPKLTDLWDEYLFGSELLVAPVTQWNADSRKVYLPAGRWLDYNGKTKVYAGPAVITAKAPLDAVPLFVREGAVIPRGDILKANNDWDKDWSPVLRVEIFPSGKTPGRFEYYTGAEVRAITVTPEKDGFSIQFGELGLKGTLEIYCRGATGVSRDGIALRAGTDYAYDAKTRKLTVPFSGPTSLVISGARGLFD